MTTNKKQKTNKGESKMTKSEMLNNWKSTSAIKSAFAKMLGEKFPALATTEPKLLKKINDTLQKLTDELSQITAEPEFEAAARKPKAKAESNEAEKPEAEAEAAA